MKTPTSIRAAGLAAAIAIIIAALPCAADTLTVTSTADDGGAGTLRSVLAQAADGDAINFAVTTPATIMLAQGVLELNKNLTITGPGRELLVVDGQNASRVLWIEANQVVSISGLTISHGRSTGAGGGIACGGSLSLTDCTISDSWAMEGGGALFADYGLLTITGCTFTGNSSTTSPDDYHGGGAVLWKAYGMGCSLVIDKSLFANNSAPFGGGISIWVRGNAEYPTQATVRVSDSTISENSSALAYPSYGGGLAVRIIGEGPGTSSASVTVENCTLSGNAVFNEWSGFGGAISQLSEYADSTLVVNNSTISDNSMSSGGYGGGIAYLNIYSEGSYNSALTVENSTLSNNQVAVTESQDAFGGALAVVGDGDVPIAVNIRNSTLTNNQIVTDGFAGGGAIFNAGTTMTVLDSTLSGNSAPSGGAIFNGFPAGITGIVSTLNVGGCVLSDNSAGLIEDEGFVSGGGAIASVAWGSGAAMTVEDSILTGNSSPIGGAVSGFTSSYEEFDGGSSITIPASSTTTVRNTTFSGNVAETGGFIAFGGAIAYIALGAEGLCNAALTVENSTLNGNSAVGTGSDAGGGAIGAICMAESTLSLRNSTFSGNTVTSDTFDMFDGGSGGAVYCRSFDNMKVDVDNCTLSGNGVSADVGGGIFNGGCLMSLKNTILNGSPGDPRPVLWGDFLFGGTIESFGNNLISDDGGGFLTAEGDQLLTDPLLGPLADNGGPTWTHALLSGSPAIDAGNSTDIAGNTVATDQRGVTRPQGGGHDIGAFERQMDASVYAAMIQPPINADGTSIFTAKRGVVPVKFTLTVDGSPTCDLPPATIGVSRIGGVISGAIGGQSYTMAADQGPYFRISDCQYIYNLPVKSLDSGTYRVDILINGELAGSAVLLLE